MPTYNIVDHRAPSWFPHKAEGNMNDGIIWIPAIVGGVAAIFSGAFLIGLGLWFFALIVPLLVLCWTRYTRHWIYPIPDGNLAYGFNDEFERMMNLYWRNPHAREAIEPLLIQCYKYVPTADTAAIKKRSRLMQQYVDENPPVASPVIEDNSDIEEFKNILAIRREMRKDGLL